MKFIVSYLFKDDKEEGLQVDLVNYKDKKSCIQAFNKDKYEIIEVEEYNEESILEDMIFEYEEYLHDCDEDECEDNDDEDDIRNLFPNANTEEELEEELEHSFTRMMDN